MPPPMVEPDGSPIPSRTPSIETRIRRMAHPLGIHAQAVDVADFDDEELYEIANVSEPSSPVSKPNKLDNGTPPTGVLTALDREQRLNRILNDELSHLHGVHNETLRELADVRTKLIRAQRKAEFFTTENVQEGGLGSIRHVSIDQQLIDATAELEEARKHEVQLAQKLDLKSRQIIELEHQLRNLSGRLNHALGRIKSLETSGGEGLLPTSVRDLNAGLRLLLGRMNHKQLMEASTNAYHFLAKSRTNPNFNPPSPAAAAPPVFNHGLGNRPEPRSRFSSGSSSDTSVAESAAVSSVDEKRGEASPRPSKASSRGPSTPSVADNGRTEIGLRIGGTPLKEVSTPSSADAGDRSDLSSKRSITPFPDFDVHRADIVPPGTPCSDTTIRRVSPSIRNHFETSPTDCFKQGYSTSQSPEYLTDEDLYRPPVRESIRASALAEALKELERYAPASPESVKRQTSPLRRKKATLLDRFKTKTKGMFRRETSLSYKK